MRLIDADLLEIETIEIEDEWHMHNAEEVVFLYNIMTATTVNAVEVVRCKDCKFFNLAKNGWNGSCDLHIDTFNTFYANDFCSYGEKK